MPKAGNRQDEYEDAFNRSIQINKDTTNYRFAIADGASESSFADLWAKLLASGYCNGKFDDRPLQKSISKLSRVWQKKLQGKDLPWYAQEKLSSGAFAAIAGITFRLTDASFTAFDAVAIGDSCIFQIRNDKMIAAFPMSSADEFHNRPVLISSNAANNGPLKDFVRTWSGIAKAGDSFLLMTDALACWLLTRYEEDLSVIKKLYGLASEQDFTRFVHAERKSISRDGGFYLRNDDVTFIRVKLL
ncbi:protein phosphatase 2C domain-containing protein [Paenibacillus montanisoli]|nr:protein phosphatase 2C domain-containing protein [Paenibacillus montanisoli]